MTQQFLQIPGLLKQEELAQIDDLAAAAHFVDGKSSASLSAKEVKHNLQIHPESQELSTIRTILDQALMTSPLFAIAALPGRICPFVVSKYESGQHYGGHIDSPIMSAPRIRTDLAMTIFLSEPDSYDGGELVIQSDVGTSAFKPAKGDAVLYPCQFIHCVNAVTRGSRLAAVTWIQSDVKNAEQRQILFQLNQIHASLHNQAPHAPETMLLLQIHSNLFRMWADI